MIKKNKQEIEHTKYVQQQIYDILIDFHTICEKYELTYVLDYGTLLGAVRHRGFIPWDDDIDVSMPREDYEKFASIMIQKMDKGETDLFFQDHYTDPKYYFPFAKLRKPENTLRELSLSHFDIVHGPWIDIFVFDDMPLDASLVTKNIRKFNKKRKFIDYITPIVDRESDSNQYAFKTFIKKKVINTLSSNNKVVYQFLDMNFQSMSNAIEEARMQGSPNSSKMISYAFLMHDEKDIKVNTIYRESFKKRRLAKFEEHSFYIPENYELVLMDRYGDYNQLPPKEERKSNHQWDLENNTK